MPYRGDVLPPEIDRSILVVGLNGHVMGLERATGQIRWKNDLRGGGTGEVFLAMRYGAVIVSSSRALVYRLDYHSGATLWQAATKASGRATILIEADSVTVAKGGYLDCFDLDGQRLWQQPPRGMGLGRAALGYPGNVEQADETGDN